VGCRTEEVRQPCFYIREAMEDSLVFCGIIRL